MKKIYLIDSSSMFFRAFYAIRSLTSPTGMPTNAIYGYLSMVLKLIKDEKPDYIAFCYDQKEATFRKKMYPDYKANRSETPPDLIPQIPYIKKIAEYLGVPAFEKAEYEADDVIGKIALFAKAQGLQVFIVSGDKDFGQLVQDHIFLYDTMKEIKYDAQGVKEKWGVRPDQIIDYLSIVGDSSDNIPGVTGIGPKGAQKLLEEFETLENIYLNLDKIKSDSIRSKLVKDKDTAFVAKKLVTICTDFELDLKLDDLKKSGIKENELRALLQELNFKSLERNIFSTESQNSFTTQLTAPGDESASVPIQAPSPIEAPLASPPAALNYVSQNIEVKSLSIEEIQIWTRGKTDIWLIQDLRGIYFAHENELVVVDSNETLLKNFLNQADFYISGFNIKDLLRSLGCEKMKVGTDLQLACYVVKAGEIKDFESAYSDFLQKSISEMPSPADMYNAYLELNEFIFKRLKELNLTGIYEDIEKPLSVVLFEIEKNGIKLDVENLSLQSQSLNQEMTQKSQIIYDLAGEVFNLASPKQLAYILFEKQKIPVVKKTKTGYSTDNEVLEKLSPEYPIAKEMVVYRELQKLKSTYVDALPLLVDAKDGRLHTHFNQALTSTGRLSSTNPNLQNIPIRTERGAKLRDAFIAEKGNLLLSADYSQIELRILAHITDDPGLCRAFKDDLDIHSATASEVFGVSLSDVTADLRRTAKAINFGIAYGQGAFGLSEQLGISRNEASEIIKKYFFKFSKVKQYMEDVVLHANEKKYVENIFGRRRYIEELSSSNMHVRKAGERAAINAPIQGAASDIVKLAMLRVFREVDLKMLLQVHDELILEGSREKIEELKPKVIEIMENIYPLKVPLKVNSSVGINWGEAH